MAVIISLTNKEAAFVWRLLYTSCDPGDVDFALSTELLTKLSTIIDKQPYAVQKTIKQSVGETDESS